MTGSGPTAHFAQYGLVLVVEQWDKKRTKDRKLLCHCSIFVPTCVCPSRRYAAEEANNRHRQASEIPVLGLADGAKPSMSNVSDVFLARPLTWDIKRSDLRPPVSC